MKIGVTMQIVRSKYREFEITDEDFARIQSGDYQLDDVLGEDTYLSFWNDVLDDGSVDDSDYQITDEHGDILEDWSK